MSYWPNEVGSWALDLAVEDKEGAMASTSVDRVAQSTITFILGDEIMTGQ